MPDRPTSSERDWLLARLADLCSEGGYQRLVSAPIVEPSDDWFPDVWRPNRAGVELLLRRLFFHAGLRELVVEVDDLRDQVPAASGLLPYSEVHYVEHAAGAVTFEIHRLGDDDLIGILSHEVGRAFLDVLGLGRGVAGPYRAAAAAPDDDGDAVRDAQLGSIATVYLGLGVPAANAAQSARARGQISGNMVTTAWQITTAGGLPAQALAYLLAVQCVVRGRSAPAYSALLTNQRSDFDDWREALADSRDELIATLRLPPESEWPQVPTALTLVPFDYVEPDDGVAMTGPARDFNRGRKVYRVRGNRWSTTAGLGLVGGMAAAVPLNMVVGGPIAFATVVGMTAVGALVGSRRRRDFCSDRGCEEPLPPDARTCPRCAGTIAGEIRHADDRLDRDELRDD